MVDHEKMSTGTNDRPRDASIGQTATGLPDDSGAVIRATPQEEKAVRRALGEPSPRDTLKQQVDEEIKASERGSE